MWVRLRDSMIHLENRKESKILSPTRFKTAWVGGRKAGVEDWSLYNARSFFPLSSFFCEGYGYGGRSTWLLYICCYFVHRVKVRRVRLMTRLISFAHHSTVLWCSDITSIAHAILLTASGSTNRCRMTLCWSYEVPWTTSVTASNPRGRLQNVCIFRVSTMLRQAAETWLQYPPHRDCLTSYCDRTSPSVFQFLLSHKRVRLACNL